MGGDSKCLMMLTMSPCATDLQETLDTLKFAESTGLIKRTPGKIVTPYVTMHDATKIWETSNRKNLEFFGIFYRNLNCVAYQKLLKEGCDD